MISVLSVAQSFLSSFTLNCPFANQGVCLRFACRSNWSDRFGLLRFAQRQPINHQESCSEVVVSRQIIGRFNVVFRSQWEPLAEVFVNVVVSIAKTGAGITIFRIVIPEIASSNPVTHPSEMARCYYVGDGSFLLAARVQSAFGRPFRACRIEPE